MYVILHNIRSAHNVGSIFRTADGAGVQKIYLTGYTPAPIDRFGREQSEIKKTSLGASSTVSYECVSDVYTCIDQLKKESVTIVAVEQTQKAIPYTKCHIHGDRVAYILGNETEGIEQSVLDRTDLHVHVPMSGKKESLNVSVCAGIILFHARDGV